MQVGRYEIEGEIARGGMGAVFRARAPGGRSVAIKILLNAASDHARRRFLREARALAKLRHPNLVAIHEVAEAEVGPYFVMELVEGASLHDRLLEETLTPSDAVRLAQGIAEALRHCHQAGVIHRDIKPGNVLITPDGEARLTDFGLAHDADPELSQLSKSGTYIGSPGFWPPEQATGDLERLGPWSDVYALGATLHAMLTGQPPFEFDSVVSAVIAAIEQPPNMSGVDLTLDALIADCLEKEPANRPPLEEVTERLAAWLPGRRPRRRLRRLVGPVAIGLVLAAVAAGGWFLAPALLPPEAFQVPPIPCVVARWESQLSPEAWKLLQDGRAAFRARDFEASAAHYLVAQKAAPGTSRLHALRAVSLTRAKREKDALAELDLAIELDPDDPQVRYNRGALRCELKDPRGALEDLDRVLAKLPKKANAWFARGAVNYQLGRYDESIADHDRAEALRPKHAENIFSRAASRAAKGDRRGALRDLDAAVTLRPRNTIYLCERAYLKQELDDLPGAIADYTRAIAVKPKDALLLARRAKVLTKKKDFKGAHDDFTAALELLPNDPGLRESRGLIRTRLGDLDGARSDLERARDLLPPGHKLLERIERWLAQVRAAQRGGRR